MMAREERLLVGGSGVIVVVSMSWPHPEPSTLVLQYFTNDAGNDAN